MRAPLTLPAAVGGLALATWLGAVAVVRRRKPLHPDGAVASGRLVVTGRAASGVALLDEPGEHEVVARLSRAMSVPGLSVDIAGLALRVVDGGSDGGPADLLLASTGTGDVGRYLLALVADEHSATMTSLLPQRGSHGPVVLRVDPNPTGYALSWSGTSGDWVPVGDVVLEPWGPDRPIRFDPTGRPLAGLTPPGWVRALRSPAYAAARALAPA